MLYILDTASVIILGRMDECKKHSVCDCTVCHELEPINCVVLVRKRTIPTEQPQFVGEVSSGSVARNSWPVGQKGGQPEPIEWFFVLVFVLGKYTTLNY
jgi:hypothetical protein